MTRLKNQRGCGFLPQRITQRDWGFQPQRPLLGFVALLSLAFLAPSLSTAAPKLSSSTKDILAEGLNDLLDSAKPDKDGEESNKPSSQKPFFAPDEGMLNDMIRDAADGSGIAPPFGEDLGQKPEQRLARVKESMGEATRLIGRLDSTGKTVKVQKQIVDDLDALIKEMEKQCQCQSSSQSKSQSSSRQQSQRSQPKPSQGDPKQGKPSQSQASKAAQQSSMRLGAADAEAVERRNADDLMKEVWGHLPERVREQMLQSSSDEFLEKYREEIELYFKRLAEEKE